MTKDTINKKGRATMEQEGLIETTESKEVLDARKRGVAVLDAWEKRADEAQKYAASRVVQLYLDKSYFVTIAASGHDGKIQDFLKSAICTEAIVRRHKEVSLASGEESHEARAYRLQEEVEALKNTLSAISGLSTKRIL